MKRVRLGERPAIASALPAVSPRFEGRTRDADLCKRSNPPRLTL